MHPVYQKLVRDGSMNYAIAIGISREHGVYADREASRLMKKAEAAGKKKLPRASLILSLMPEKQESFLSLFLHVLRTLVKC